MTENKTTIDEQSRIYILAEHVKVLLGFAATLIPELDLIEKAMDGSREKANFAMSAAPVLGAFGIDYDKANKDWALKNKRAKAIYNLVKVLKETDEEMQANKESEAQIEKNRQEIKNILGI